MKSAHENILVLRAEKTSQWDDFVSSHPGGSIYHTTAWMHVIQKTYRYEPLYIYLERGGEIRACLPIFRMKNLFFGERFSTVPMAATCNPLGDDEDLVKLMDDFRKRAGAENEFSWEIRADERFLFQLPGPHDSTSKYVTHRLDLGRTLDEIWNSFHQGQIVRSIRKARRSSLDLVRVQSRNDVSKFYRLYLHMRKQNGLLPMPLSFFLNLWDEFEPLGQIEIHLARLDSRPVSGILLLKFCDTVIYEYGATETHALSARPSQLLLWKGIEDAHAEGYQWFDFGRTSLDNNGLITFKDRWGTSRVQLVSFQIPGEGSVDRLREGHLSKMAMQVVINNSPDWLCQRLGSWLYRYTI